MTTSQNAIQVIASPVTGTLPGGSLVTQVNGALDSIARMFNGPAAPTSAGLGLGLASLAGIKWHDTTATRLRPLVKRFAEMIRQKSVSPMVFTI